MRNTSKVLPENKPVPNNKTMSQANSETVIGGPSTPSQPPKQSVGSADDFSLPSPKQIELPGMKPRTRSTSKDETKIPEEDTYAFPYPLYHLKGRNLIEPVRVDCVRGSLNSGDVFVLDMRSHPLYCVITWVGAEGNRREKAAGRGFCDKLQNEPTKMPTKPMVVEITDRQTPMDQHLAHADAFWDLLGGRGKILGADEVSDDRTITLVRRKSLKIAQRNSLLANMTRSQSFKFMMKEKMESVSQILHNKWWTLWISSLTVYALFGDDIRFMATDKSSDPVFFSISIVCLFFFVAEIFLNWVGNPGWCLGFYFWLDFAATVSLIPDIGWIWDPLFAALSGSNAAGGDGNGAQDALKGKEENGFFFLFFTNKLIFFLFFFSFFFFSLFEQHSWSFISFRC